MTLPDHNSGEPVAEEVEDSPGTEDHEPEPEKDVDLLVHHIQGEDAHS